METNLFLYKSYGNAGLVIINCICYKDPNPIKNNNNQIPAATITHTKRNLTILFILLND